MPSIADLNKLLALDPADPFVLYGLAQEYAKQGDHAAALGFYDRCLVADPAYCYAYFHKARSLEAMGKVPEAVETLTQGVAAAKLAQDGHAFSELSAYLDELSP
jgi:tetratricopeptide (TPR) repeat protein